MTQAIMESPVLYVLGGCVALFVIAQSVFFLVKAWRRGLEIGMSRGKLKKIALTAAVFTVAPAVAIVISVIVLSLNLFGDGLRDAFDPKLTN